MEELKAVIDLFSLIRSTSTCPLNTLLLSFAVLTAAWLVLSWFYKGVNIGLRRDLRDIILNHFQLEHNSGKIPIAKLVKAPIHSSDGPLEVCVGDVLNLAFSFKLFGWCVRAFSGVFALSIVAAGLMHLAQPIDGISLIRVFGPLGFGSFLCFLLLSGISVAKAYWDARIIPPQLVGQQSVTKVVLFLF